MEIIVLFYSYWLIIRKFYVNLLIMVFCIEKLVERKVFASHFSVIIYRDSNHRFNLFCSVHAYF